MITHINHETYGTIVYEESVWTGKKTIMINGSVLPKAGKNQFLFVTPMGNIPVTTKGSMSFGAKLIIGSETIVVSPAPKWYECVLAIMPFLLVILWSNSLALCSIVPVVGGALGGAISGMFGVLSLTSMKNKSNIVIKVLIGMGMLVACFFVCALLGVVMVSALS